MNTPPVPTKLLLDEPPLIVQPSLAKLIGLEDAIILQQMHYWLGRSRHVHAGRPWIYNSYAAWQEQMPFLSVGTVRRTITRLEARGLILSGNFNASPLDQTKWYTIVYEAVAALVDGPGGPAPAPPPSGKNDTWSVENANWSVDSARPCDQSDQAMCADCADATDQIDHMIHTETSVQETNTETTGGVGVEEGPAPAPAAPPPPPPEQSAEATTDLSTLTVARYRALIAPRAAPAQAARIARDVAAALARGHPLTARGLEHALLEAAGKRDPWEFAIKVWRAKPDGPPPEGASHDLATTHGPAGPGAPALPDRAAADAATARLRTRLARRLPGPGPPAR
jgi:hypothetical protein